MRLLCGLLAVFLATAFVSPQSGVAEAQPLTPPQAQAADPTGQSDPAVSEEAAERPPDDEEAGRAQIPRRVLDPEISGAELKIRLTPLTQDELATVAAAWQEIVKRRTTMVTDQQIRLADANPAAKAASRERLLRLVEERNALLEKFTTVVDAWAAKGGDDAKVKTYREYRSAILSEEAQTTDFETFLVKVQSWLTDEEGGMRWGINLGIVLAAILVLLVIAALARRATRRWIGRAKHLSKLLQAFIVTFVYWLVLAVGLLVVVSAIGIDVAPIFALIGGASFILAFAFQDTLGNLASGLMIMINRPFDEGDYVDVAGVSGTVQSVSIVATEVLTPDNQVIVIPNKQVWGAVITNVTGSKTRRVDLTFGIGYQDSIEKAQHVLEETVAAHPMVLQDPPTIIRVSELADSSVNFIVRPWVKSEDYWTVYWDLTRQVKEAFDRAGISIPFPQRDMHVYREESPSQASQDEQTPRASKQVAADGLTESIEPDPAKAQSRGEEGHPSDDER